MSGSIPTKRTPRTDVSSPDQRLDRVKQIARLLDTAIRIPWTPIRFGVDSLIGLVPGLGDALGTALSGYILFEAARLGASKRLLLRMLSNVAVDTLLGLVPLVGDLFDVFWKANDRNVQLLARHVQDPDGTKSATTFFFATIFVALLGLVAASAIAVGWGLRVLMG